ncbi:MAG: hypothetical protein KZQ57_07590, partial [gamma proteobacterium symbiont of Lucinoma myriamae]|nr:hypothetical protein [gamma proteobacterium symbiont of Lucinoma myriamae]
RHTNYFHSIAEYCTMPNQIIWENKGVLSRYTGLFSPEIHIDVLDKLFGDPRIDDIKYIIGDYSEVNDDLLTEDNVEYPLAMTMGTASYLQDFKIALVAKDKGIIELCNSYIELFRRINTSWEVKLFDDIDTARDWIASVNDK